MAPSVIQALGDKELRKLIAILRRLILGPSLDRLSRLTNAEVQNLLHVSSEDPIMGLLKASATATPAAAVSGGTSVNESEIRQLIQELRTHQAATEDRIAVLETLVKSLTARHS